MRSTKFMTTGLLGLILFGCVAGAQVAMPAMAQEAPAAAPAAKADDAPQTIVVEGKKIQNKIDRQVYDNTKDIDSQTGTAADALNKVPSVNIDPSGNVTLRGNSSVQVYVDGKPSVMMQGDNRAGALQSMASGDIDSIEVMTNPGAQFSSEGSGGIINLVMRKNRKPGNTGAVNANVGDGRYNASLNGARNTGKYTISGGLNIRHDERPSRSGSVSENLVNDITTEQSGASEGHNDNISANVGLDYNLGDKDTLGTQIAYSRRELDSSSLDNYATYDADGAFLNGYQRNSRSTGPRDDFSFDVNWNHTGALTGESLKVDLRLGRSTGDTATAATNTYTDRVTAETREAESDFHNSVLSVDYVRPFGEAQMTTGVQITSDDNSFNNTATGDNSAGLISAFAYKQTITAGYATWQMPIGEKWTIMGGVRAEALDLDTENFGNPDTDADDTTSHINYTKFSPSAFATYDLGIGKKLRFSYSHRLQRPSPQDLNPFQTYQDPQNVSAGNPNLKPAETDSFEAGYEVSAGKTSYQIRGYYRQTEDSITSYSYYLPQTDPTATLVLLTTKQNAGENKAGGLEGNFNGKIGQKLSINANANLAYNRLTTPNTGEQEATTLSGRVSLDYTITAKDRFQISYFGRGKQLTGQGYTGPFGMGNMSYRHQYTPKAALVVTVQDPFRTAKFRTVVDTDTVHSESARSLQGQVFMIGLSYTLGGPSANKSGDNRWNGQRGPGGGGGWGGPGGGGPM